MKGVQNRTTPRPPSLVKRADGLLPTITGFAAVYYDPADPGTEYKLWYDTVERIRPGAFTRAIGGDDVRALFNHDPNHVLGRTKAGTLRLFDDAKGVRYEIDPPDTMSGRDTVTVLQRGDVSGSSFSFVPDRVTFEEVRQEDGSWRYIRWVEDVTLYDVGPVTFPAYPSTDAAAGVRADRGDDGRAEFEAWRKGRRSAAGADYTAVALLEIETILADG